MNYLSLFSGVGGLDLGLDRAGMTCVGQVEIDPYCRSVLDRHWPEVPKHDDVRTAVDWWSSSPRPSLDIVAGGFPCQPVSQAGLKQAQGDERWLWEPMRDVIAATTPTWVIGENVSGLRDRGLTLVLRDLDRLGYRARPGFIRACEVGAPHPRERMFILAHTTREGRCPWRAPSRSKGQASGEQAHRPQPARGSWWAVEPGVRRVAYGVPARVDRLRALGNAVVPQVAEHIGQLILAADHAQAVTR